MSNLHPIRDFIAVNSDNPDELRSRWAAESKLTEKASVPMQTATFNFLDSLVNERVEQIEASKSAARLAEAERIQAELRRQNTEVRSQFKLLLEKGAATVSNGALHFSHDGTAYTVFKKDSAFVLNGGQIKEMALIGDGDSVTKLVNTLASLRTF